MSQTQETMICSYCECSIIEFYVKINEFIFCSDECSSKKESYSFTLEELRGDYMDILNNLFSFNHN